VRWERIGTGCGLLAPVRAKRGARHVSWKRSQRVVASARILPRGINSTHLTSAMENLGFHIKLPSQSFFPSPCPEVIEILRDSIRRSLHRLLSAGVRRTPPSVNNPSPSFVLLNDVLDEPVSLPTNRCLAASLVGTKPPCYLLKLSPSETEKLAEETQLTDRHVRHIGKIVGRLIDRRDILLITFRKHPTDLPVIFTPISAAPAQLVTVHISGLLSGHALREGRFSSASRGDIIRRPCSSAVP